MTTTATTRSGRRWSQRPDEVREFIALLRKENVRSYLELGAREGDTFFAIAKALPQGSTVVAVDMPGGAWGRAETRAHLEAAVHELCERGYDARAIFGDLRSAGTRNIVQRLGPFDAMLIDADHGLDAVTADWREYGSLARMVAFHDIDGAGQKTSGGYRVEVPALWASLKRKHRTCEIIGRQRGMGLGVVWH